jgi:hypothetical protein
MNDMAINEVNATADDCIIDLSAYDPKLGVQASEGKRIVKCLYKAPKKGEKAPHENVYGEVPLLSDGEIRENMEVLLPHFRGFLESVQDGLVKEYHKQGKLEIPCKDVDLSAIIAKLEEETQGRLNKEAVFAWFDANVADALLVALANKLGVGDVPTDEQATKLETVLGAYRTKFGALAGGKSVFMKEEAERLLRALDVAQASDPLAQRFRARLEAMTKPQEELLELL